MTSAWIMLLLHYHWVEQNRNVEKPYLRP